MSLQSMGKWRSTLLPLSATSAARLCIDFHLLQHTERFRVGRKSVRDGYLSRDKLSRRAGTTDYIRFTYRGINYVQDQLE